MRTPLLILATAALTSFVTLQAADPTTPIHWSASKTKELAAGAKARLNAQSGMATSRLMDSAFMVHREKTSQAEAHTESADFIIINDGSGTILVGGKIINGKPDRPGEIRGDSIEGGTPFAVKAGDTLYVPKAAPHQFQVETGKFIVYTIVKVTPVE